MKLEKEPDEERSLFLFHFAVYKRRISIKESGERAGGFNWGCDSWKRERERERERRRNDNSGNGTKNDDDDNSRMGEEKLSRSDPISNISHASCFCCCCCCSKLYIRRREREREGGNIVKALSVPVSAKSRSESKIPDRHKRKKRNERWPSSAAKNIEGTTKNCITQYCIKKSNTIREMVTFFPTVLIGSHAGL